jgi:hypothetical protein
LNARALNDGFTALNSVAAMSQTGRLRSVASHPIEGDNADHDATSNKYWTLYARVIVDQRFDLNGGQGWNRTTDTRIFNPLNSAPSVT